MNIKGYWLGFLIEAAHGGGTHARVDGGENVEDHSGSGDGVVGDVGQGGVDKRNVRKGGAQCGQVTNGMGGFAMKMNCSHATTLHETVAFGFLLGLRLIAVLFLACKDKCKGER